MSETRMARVGDQIQREIATLLSSGGLKDDRIGFVTITGVKVSPDLAEAKVFYSVHGTAEEQAASAKALLENVKAIRHYVSRNMKIRHTPVLHLVHDESIEEGAKIDRLLKEVRAKEGW